MSKRAERDLATVNLKASHGQPREISPRVREVVEGLNELCDALEAGVPLERMARVRTYQIDFTPPDLSPVAIRAIRESLGLNQSLFAAFLGIGVQTLRSWEQGQREPSPLARRLLGAIRDDPKYWRRKLARSAVRKHSSEAHREPSEPV
jgi:DNA-binding transcriptional regulator YiaG